MSTIPGRQRGEPMFKKQKHDLTNDCTPPRILPGAESAPTSYATSRSVESALQPAESPRQPLSTTSSEILSTTDQSRSNHYASRATITRPEKKPASDQRGSKALMAEFGIFWTMQDDRRVLNVPCTAPDGALEQVRAALDRERT